MTSSSVEPPAGEPWEEEVLARHRWGQHGVRASEELARLKGLWKMIQPLTESCETVVPQILALEICNWNLEEGILALCRGIGSKKPVNRGIGHLSSVSEERWKEIWAYYLTLRDWLPSGGQSGYETLLTMCDPERTIQDHILGFLGSRSELKELYVERFCLCLEFWLGGYFPRESAQMRTHDAAVLVVEEQISKHDPEGRILNAMKMQGDGRLQPCHHKAVRRYDIIISSIGAGKWRAVMPRRGTDGLERAAGLERYLLPICAWIGARGERREYEEDELFKRIHTLLGKPDNTKRFLASLLVSLLRAQQLAARERAESRKKES